MIPQETVGKILDASQIAEVVGDFVTLKRRGGDFVACCPFHNEKTPSFHVSPTRGIYKCFGCGKAGSSVGFLMEHEHMTYTEALRYLANKYHIEIVEKDETPEEIAARQRGESLYIVSDFASKFFVNALSTTEGRSIGYAYFKSRGLTDETIQKYGLGWAPKSKHALTDAATMAGYKAEYLVETGLCAQTQYEGGGVMDRFYDRVIFPIHSVSGRVIAFGGRTLYSDYKEKGIGKYVNSKESEIYVKSRSLYGIWFAKNEIAKKDKCYLVEGYLDVLSMHQLGITNVVASSGTSLTEDQIKIIKRFTNNVTIMYDGDAAGIHAAMRGIGMILKEGMDVKIVLIPDGDDPDSYSRKHTLSEVESFIAANEQDFIQFKTDLLLKDAGDDPLKRANLINDIADTIAEIPDAVKRSVYADSCGRKFNIDSQILFARIKSTMEKTIVDEKLSRSRATYSSSVSSAPAQSTGTPSGRPLQAVATDPFDLIEENKVLGPTERDILYFLLTHGSDPMEFETDSEFYNPDEQTSVADFICGSFEEDNLRFYNSAYQNVYDLYMDAYYSEEAPSQDTIVRRLLNSPDDKVRFISSQLSMEKYQLTVQSFKDSLTTTSSWLVVSVPRLLLNNLERRIDNQLNEVKKSMAEKKDDMAAQMSLMEEFMALTESKKLVRAKLGKERED